MQNQNDDVLIGSLIDSLEQPTSISSSSLNTSLLLSYRYTVLFGQSGTFTQQIDAAGGSQDQNGNFTRRVTGLSLRLFMMREFRSRQG